jgi:aminomuconate-semialdehyde/2-hydroxymuconate-6-semialdehyde dehydrogenase
MTQIHNYINGELIAPLEGQYLDNYNPAKGEVYSQIPNSNTKDVELAYQAAKAAFPAWSATSKEERSNIMQRIADLIDKNLNALALAESIDNGKPVKLAAHVDIPRAAANMRFYATAILHYASESHIMDNGFVNYTLRKPIGVVGCISPWNLPLYLYYLENCPCLSCW